jgi:subtilisin family serine protease
VVLLSLGSTVIQPSEAEELENRIVRVRRAFDWNVVVAAGNSGGGPDFPGRFPSSFTVAASDARGELCSFSARGRGIDIAAPGCGIDQTGWDGGWWRLSGTSFAAPIVAGALAAVRSYAPGMTASAAEDLLLRTALSRISGIPQLRS